MKFRFTATLLLVVLFPYPSFAVPSPQQRQDTINASLDSIEYAYNEIPYSNDDPFRDIPEDNNQISAVPSKEIYTPVNGGAIGNSDTGIRNQKLWPQKTHSFEIAPEIFHYTYKEPGLMELSGTWHGWSGEYIYRPEEGKFLNNSIIDSYAIEFMYATSKNDYEGGATISGTHYPLEMKDIKSAMAEVRALIGKDYFISDDTRLTPFTGFGMRQKADKSGGIITEVSPGQYAASYDRRATYFYIPLGVQVDRRMDNDFELGASLEYDVLIQGYTKSHNTDVDEYTLPAYGNEDATFNQGHGFGMKASLKLMKRSRWIDFFVEPYIRYWNIKESDPQTITAFNATDTYVEPDNNTTEIGSKFGARF